MTKWDITPVQGLLTAVEEDLAHELLVGVSCMCVGPCPLAALEFLPCLNKPPNS